MLAWVFSSHDSSGMPKCFTLYTDPGGMVTKEASVCGPFTCYEEGDYCRLEAVGAGASYAGAVAPTALDEVRVYNRALSADEVRALYAY